MIELMIGITIAMFVLTITASLLSGVSVSKRELHNNGEQIENGRQALHKIMADVEDAGFWGHGFPYSRVDTSSKDPCTPAVSDFTVPGNLYGVVLVPPSIQGSDGTKLSCVPSTYKSDSDVLVVRRASTVTVNPSSIDDEDEDLFIQTSSCLYSYENNDSARVHIGAADDLTLKSRPTSGSTCHSLASARKYLVNIYFLGSDRRLYVMNSNGSVMGTPTPLVDGIDDLRIQYGMDLDVNGTPDCYVRNPASPAEAEITACHAMVSTYSFSVPATNWGNVVTLKIHILAVNSKPSPSWLDTRSYILGADTVSQLNDKYKRHVYSATLRIPSLGYLRGQ